MAGFPIRNWSLTFALLISAAGPLPARVQLVEPWSPSIDTGTPERPWVHGATLRTGFNGVDALELAYQLSHAPAPGWEVEGSLGYASIDGSGRDDSGLNDLTVAAKHVLPINLLREIVGTGEAGISLPTGDPDNGLGAGGVGLLFGWGMEAPVQRVVGYAHFGFRAYTEGNDTHFGNVFSYVLGAAQTVKGDTRLSLDLRGFNRGKDKINGVRARNSLQELYLAPGGEWKASNLPAEFLGSLLIGLTDESYDIGILAGVKF
jgi:hypothetical protein